jgi:hypothetical protein
MPPGHKIGSIMLFKKTTESLTAAQPAIQPAVQKTTTPPTNVEATAIEKPMAKREKPQETNAAKPTLFSVKPEEIKKEISEEIEEMEEVERETRGRKKTAFNEVFISAGADVPKQITMEKKEADTKKEKPQERKGDKKTKKTVKQKKPKG